MAPPMFDASVLPMSLLTKINAPTPVQSPSAVWSPWCQVPQEEEESRDARTKGNRQSALNLANPGRSEKDVTDQILKTIVQLIDFPSSPHAVSVDPSDDDAATFKTLITDFLPEDYDSLLEERKCASKCGYVLCSNKPKIDAKLGKNMLVVRGCRLQVLPREALWCSDDCEQRALFVKQQLLTEPAWMRRSGTVCEIALKPPLPQRGLGEDLDYCMSGLSLEMDDSQSLCKATANLSLGRGEMSAAARSSGLVRDIIHENTNLSTPMPPGFWSIDGLGSRIPPYGKMMHDEDGDWVM